MNNDDMLRNIEYLREKADVSYEEAAKLLEQYDGNVMRALVELERQGRVFSQGSTPEQGRQEAEQARKSAECKEKTTGFINRAFQHHLVVESGSGGERTTVADLSVPYCVGAAVVAPWLAVASAGLAFVCGYRVRIKKKAVENVVPDDVEAFVDRTVSNIKKTASSLSDTVRGGKHDDDDEGGEITIE